MTLTILIAIAVVCVLVFVSTKKKKQTSTNSVSTPPPSGVVDNLGKDPLPPQDLIERNVVAKQDVNEISSVSQPKSDTRPTKKTVTNKSAKDSQKKIAKNKTTKSK